MKTLSIIGLLIIAVSVAAVGQETGDVSKTVRTLWTQKRFDELSKYISEAERSHPHAARVVLASAFHDYAFTGEVRRADAKLERLERAAKAHPNAFPPGFMERIEVFRRMISDGIRAAKRAGKTEEDIKRASNPAIAREALGESNNLPLDLLDVAPDVPVD